MKARYFAVMFIVLALFLSSGCGGSSGGDVRINSNTNTNTITSQDQTGDNTGDNTNNDTGTITSNDHPPTPPTTSGDQTGNDTGNTTSNDQSGNTDTDTNTNTNNNTGNTSLTFDSTSYTTGTANGVTYRAYSNITYVASPVNESYQQLSIYIPETYISGGTLDGYTASTAPIFMANGSAGYSAAGISTPDRSTSAGAALAKGYVVASPAIRGRDVSNGTAPACIVDYKAAVRYIKYNASRLPAGNVDRIISCGTSAGGAISSLLGATGNSPDYETWLEELGAADASDDIFASICYCPITNLDNADGAYEWTFGDSSTASTTLASQFITYVNSLGLGYTLSTDGTGTFADYLESLGISLSTYGATRDKTQIPAFDRLDLSSAENKEFGNKHFTDYGYDNNTASTNAMADSDVIIAMNPMNYIGVDGVDTAQYWFIRHGMNDRDTSLAVPALLALKLQNAGCTVDFKAVSGQGHGGDYDIDNILSSIDSILQ